MAAPSVSSPLFAASARNAGKSSPSSSFSSSNDSFLVDRSLDDDHHEDDDDAAADFYAIPHNLTSFLDRRPLAWRTRPLMPTATDRLAKDIHDAHYHDHGHGHDHDLDVHYTQHEHTPSHRGRTRTARTRDNDMERMRFDMADFVKSTVWANHDTVRLRPSVCGQHSGEQPVKGIFVDVPDADVPQWLLPTQGEHMHLHADGSAHMVLSLADAAKAVECGWAERLPLPVFDDGDGNDDTRMGSIQYILVHAPRCASELADWKRLVLASVRFCTFTSRDLCIRRPERL
ncbi:hypothetical protein SCUCBS95973_006054 [Sporothrix curviconia]|uniref:Luciferase domain-containing protein n=1 Tax=Sporothrix curviconia TaxID=1260050 RepID=A0ABP0C1Y0_9PEZI